MKWWRAIFIFIAAVQPCAAQKNVLIDIIHSNSLELKYHNVFEHTSRYHFQVIYTQINRDSNNVAHLKKHYLYPPTTNYYYPASLVKLPLVALALEKIDSLNKIYGITKDTRLKIDSAYKCETTELYDSTSATNYPSIAQYIKRMLLVSDNYAYNRLYEFLTPKYINRRLHELGYKDAIINQRFNPNCDSTANRYTNPFTFLADDGAVMYKQAGDSNMGNINNVALHTVIGKGFMDDKNVKMKPARDFRRNNYMPFKNENDILLSIIFPHDFPPAHRFRLSKEDYEFLYTYMGMLPKESEHPHYDRVNYPDNLKKYIYFGTSDTINSTSVRSLNIVGRAYGFLADCTYMIDTVTHAEFCLSVLMYLNEKNVLNTGKYEYIDIGLPFMTDLGQAIMEYERKRKRKYEPDLSKFSNLWNTNK
ncbi:MAG TPA: serine hydrolase [Bacteroidia bacterium]|jgi:hypothetical protein|nr:serine hydrolase [Bacteroidia bacterium]